LTPFETAGLTVFILVLFLGVFSTVFGLPGTLIILIDVICYGFATGFERVGIKVLLVLAAMAILAEAIDVGLNMAGVANLGSSKRGLWMSLIGSLLGAIIMTPFFFGLGTLLGIFLGGAIGVFAAAFLEQRKLKSAFRASLGAMLGRVAGIASRGIFSIFMVVIALYQIYS
jgi:uncharacterized protein